MSEKIDDDKIEHLWRYIHCQPFFNIIIQDHLNIVPGYDMLRRNKINFDAPAS